MAAIFLTPFQRHFLNENICVYIDIYLNFVTWVPIFNKPVLVQITAWRRTGDKPLSEQVMAWFTDAYT